jgi:tRNA A-37 threonylcarbamoyl transferase component Bud32
MKPVHFRGWRGHVTSGFEDPAVLIRLTSIRETIARGDATVIYISGGRAVAVIRPMIDGREVPLLLKEDKIVQSDLRALLKSHLRPSHLRKTWRRALQLQEGGVTVQSPVALLEWRRWGILQAVVYACEYLPHAVSLTQALHDGGVHAGLDGLLATLAKDLRSMHDRGFYHGDLKADNILIEWRADHWTITFIDLEGVAARGSLTERERAIDLGRLWWSLSSLTTRADRDRLLESYSGIAPFLDRAMLERLIDQRVDYLKTRRFGALPHIGRLLRERHDQQRWLLIALGSRRDVDSLVPLLDVLHQGFPPVRVDLLAIDGIMSHPGLMTHVQNLMSIQSSGITQTLRALRTHHYDVAIDVTGSVQSALLTRATGAGIRIGYRSPSTLVKWLKRATCYTHMIMARAGQRELIHHYLLIAEALDLGSADKAARALLSSEDHRATAQFMLGERV